MSDITLEDMRAFIPKDTDLSQLIHTLLSGARIHQIPSLPADFNPPLTPDELKIQVRRASFRNLSLLAADHFDVAFFSACLRDPSRVLRIPSLLKILF